MSLKKIISNVIQVLGINQLHYTLTKKRYKAVILCYHRISEGALRKQISFLKLTRQRIPLALWAEYEAAKRLVLNKVTAAFGGKLRFAVSGGGNKRSLM